MDTLMDVPIRVMSYSVLLVGVFLVGILLHHKSKPKQGIPPAPRPLPIIGHFHLLLDKKKPIHQILYSLSTVYGPIMSLKFGSRPVLVINSSDLAKECFTVNDLALASRPQLVQGKHLSYDYSMLGWAPYGPYWRTVRKICVLELLSSKRIQSFQSKRIQEISKAMESLYDQAISKKIINMKYFLSQLTFKVLMSMIVDDRYFGEESGVPVDEVTHLIEESFVLHGVIDIGDYIPWLKWLDLQGHEKAMKKLQVKLDMYMQRIVQAHRENGSEGNKEEVDFVDVLISQGENRDDILDKDKFIKATTLVMFLAGTDTSSVALEWALSSLLRNPLVMKKAQDELDSKIGKDRLVEESDIPHLNYLQAVVKETLRLHPPAPMLIPHESIEACTVGGFRVPVGTTVMVNAWAIQRDPKVWSEPLEFKPERFMERDIDIDNILWKGYEFEMMPFGAGRRGCPGSLLGMCMVQIILARLLQCFNLGVSEEYENTLDMSEGFGMTMPKAVALHVTVNPRLEHHLYSNSI